MPFNFAWSVEDEPSHNDYSYQVNSDGKITNGSYRVVLPDGRTQMVTYRADENGYVADFQYEGAAKYPKYKPPCLKAVYPAYPAQQPSNSFSLLPGAKLAHGLIST